MSVSRRRLLQLLMATGAVAATTVAPHPQQRRHQAANDQLGSKANDGIRDDKSPRILIVEDHPRLAHLLGKGLGKYGFATVIAKDGEEALQQVQNEQFDLICLPTLLCVRQKYIELVRWVGIRELRRQSLQAPIVAYGYLSYRDYEVMRMNGHEIDSHISHPFKLKEFIALVQKMLGR